MKTSNKISSLYSADEAVASKNYRYFHRDLRSQITLLNSQESALSVPEWPSGALAETSEFLCFQWWIFTKKEISIHIQVKTSSSGPISILFSSEHHSVQYNKKTLKLGIDCLKKDQWTNQCVSIPSLLLLINPSINYLFIQRISIKGYCKLKQILALKSPLSESNPLPRSLDFLYTIKYTNHLILSRSFTKNTKETHRDNAINLRRFSSFAVNDSPPLQIRPRKRLKPIEGADFTSCTRLTSASNSSYLPPTKLPPPPDYYAAYLSTLLDHRPHSPLITK